MTGRSRFGLSLSTHTGTSLVSFGAQAMVRPLKPEPSPRRFVPGRPCPLPTRDWCRRRAPMPESKV